MIIIITIIRSQNLPDYRPQESLSMMEARSLLLSNAAARCGPAN
jgi:hypothetical protein